MGVRRSFADFAPIWPRYFSSDATIRSIGSRPLSSSRKSPALDSVISRSFDLGRLGTGFDQPHVGGLPPALVSLELELDSLVRVEDPVPFHPDRRLVDKDVPRMLLRLDESVPFHVLEELHLARHALSPPISRCEV